MRNDAERDYTALAAEAGNVDRELMADLERAGGQKYARLAALAYRQAIAALTLDGGPHDITIHVELRDGSRLSLAGIERKARLLERALQLNLSFQRVVSVEKARVA